MNDIKSVIQQNMEDIGMSKMIKINVQLESSRAEGTRTVLVERYDIESVWQSSTKGLGTVCLAYDRGSNVIYTEDLKIDDAEFDRLSKILTEEDKE